MQTVDVVNAGTGTPGQLAIDSIEYTSGGRGWLSARLSGATAPATLTLEVAADSLPQGNHVASVLVASPEATRSPERLTVTLQVVGVLAMKLLPDSLSFTTQLGSAGPNAQPVSVTSIGTLGLSGVEIGPISYGAGASDWLVRGLSSSVAPATLTMIPRTGTLTPGTYTASIPVNASGLRIPPRLKVTMTVLERPTISLAAASLGFTQRTGTIPPPQTVAITNSGPGALGGLSIGSISYGPSGTGWLAATLSQATAPAVLTVSPRTDLFQAGTYTANVPVLSGGASNSPQIVGVTLTITSPSGEAVREAMSAALAAPRDVDRAREVLRKISALFATHNANDALANYVTSRNQAVQGVSSVTLREWATTFREAERLAAVSLQATSVRVAPSRSGQALAESDAAAVLYVNGISTAPSDADATMNFLRANVFVRLGWAAPRYTLGRLENPDVNLVADLLESGANILSVLGWGPSTQVARTAAAKLDEVMATERRRVVIVAHSQGNLIALEALPFVGSANCVGIVSIATPLTTGWPSQIRVPSRGFVAGSGGNFSPGPFDDVITMSPSFSRQLPPNFIFGPTPISAAMASSASPGQGALLVQRIDLHLIDSHYLTSRGAIETIASQIAEVDRAVQTSCGSVVATPAVVAVPLGQSNVLQLRHESLSGNKAVDSISIRPEGIALVTNTGGVENFLVTGLRAGTATLRVRAGPLLLNVPITVAMPTLAVLPTTVSFTSDQGAPSPAPRTVSVFNAAQGTLANLSIGTIRYGGGGSAWATADLDRTTTPATVTIRLTTSALVGGNYTAQIPIIAPGVPNSPQDIAVALSVRGRPDMPSSCTQTCPMRCSLGGVSASVASGKRFMNEQRIEVPRFYWPGVTLADVTLESRLRGNLSPKMNTPPAPINRGFAFTQFILSYYAPDGSVQRDARFNNEQTVGTGPQGEGVTFDQVSSGSTFQSYGYVQYLRADQPNQTRTATINAGGDFLEAVGNAGSATGEWTIIYQCVNPP